MASFTVNFSDGTSHTYDNVPDNITQDQVNERASNEFSDKEIAHISSGGPNVETAAAGPSIAEKVAAGIQTGFQTAGHIAKEIATNPLVDLAAAYRYGPRIAGKMGEAWRGGPAPTGPVAPQSNIIVPENVGGGPRPAPSMGTPQQTFNALKNTPVTPPAPAVGGPAAAEGSTFIQRLAQQYGSMAQRVAPVLNNPVTRAVGTGLNMATPAMAFAAPYQMAAQEQEKIRANPTAPEYANNPYAMMIRGEAKTQGQAGAINRRRALGQLPSLNNQ